MDFSGYTNQQKEALLDLLLFSMYLDGNLSAIEDRRIGELLATMELPSDEARQRYLDAAYTRTRQRSSSAEGLRAFVAEIAKHFSEPDLKRRTFNLVMSMVSSDDNVIEKERALLAVLREEFKLRPSTG